MDSVELPPFEKPKPLFQKRAVPFALGVCSAVAICYFLAAVITYVQPREYLGSVTIEVPQDAVTHFANVWNESTEQSLSPQETLIEIIRSNRVLGQVIDKHRLTDDRQFAEWFDVSSRTEAFSALQGIVEVEPGPDVGLVVVKVFYLDPYEAVSIADSVVEAYQAYLDKPAIYGESAAVEALLVQEAEQQVRVQESRTRMLDLMKEHEIVDPSSFLFPFYDVTDDVKEHVSETEVKLKSIQDLHGEHLVARVDFVFPGVSISANYDAYRELRATNANPEAIAPRWKELMESAIALQSAYTTRVEITKASLLNAHKAPPSRRGSGADLPVYVEAKQRYLDADLAITKLQKARLAEIDRVVPDFERIAIHHSTPPSEVPAKPVVHLQLKAGIVIGLIVSPFFGLAFGFVAGILERRHRPRPRKPRPPKPVVQDPEW